MERYITIEDAPILIPNRSHLNFTQSNNFIPIGTEIIGEEKFITGKRRGEPFNYRLFMTDKKQLIHLNKVKPMETTEVKLGADAKPTEINIINKKNISVHTIIGTGVGAGIGYYYSNKKGYDTQKKAIITIVCGIIGFFVGKQAQKSGILIKK